jgi:hypothetical protein
VAAAREVIGLWRLTAEANTADQQPLLATALANLGLGLHDLGQSREAVAAAEEAVGLWRPLAKATPSTSPTSPGRSAISATACTTWAATGTRWPPPRKPSACGRRLPEGIRSVLSFVPTGFEAYGTSILRR